MAEARAGDALVCLYEDPYVLAFDKPSGLAVQGGSGVEENLEDVLKAYARPGKPLRLVHRLDRETSGVIVVARTKTSAAALGHAFAARTANKTYVAITGAAPDPAAGVIAAPLKRASQKGVDVMRVAAAGEPGALPAITQYRTLARARDGALLSLKPKTGRMHQLRAHLASIGAPIGGDGKYGGLYALGKVKMSRLMLHALGLEIAHPKGGILTLKAPPPPAFRAAAAALGLGAAFDEAGE